MQIIKENRRKGKMLFSLLLCLSAIAFMPSAAGAQQRIKAAASAPQPSQPSGASLSIYEEKLNRMAEILGSLHYLYTLCALPIETAAAEKTAESPSSWRDYMQRLLAALQADAAQNARFAASFNRSYYAFADNYNSCAAGAKEALQRYRLEGQALSSSLTAEFGYTPSVP